MSFPNFSLANIKCFTVATTYAFPKISVCKFCDLYSKYACPRRAPAPNFHLLSKNCLPYPHTYAYFPAGANRWAAAAANLFASFGVGFQFYFFIIWPRRQKVLSSVFMHIAGYEFSQGTVRRSGGIK
jgi:hypothetical protein